MTYILNKKDFNDYRNLFLYSFNYDGNLQVDAFLKKYLKNQ
jgi:hypothetical protein